MYKQSLFTKQTNRIFIITIENILYNLECIQYTSFNRMQDGWVVNTPAFGSKGRRFDTRQQPFVQLKQSHTNSVKINFNCLSQETNTRFRDIAETLREEL